MRKRNNLPVKEKLLEELSQSLKKDVETECLGRTRQLSIISRVLSEQSQHRFNFAFSSRALIAASFAAAFLVILFGLYYINRIIPDSNGLMDSAAPPFKDSDMGEVKSDEDLISQKESFDLIARKQDGNIELVWQKHGDKAYKISRSTSPKDFSDAYTVVVAGNRWIDPVKNGSNIVYYKIE
ncbi:MAG: hypothetical protein AB1297_05490 [bacterium]